MIDINAARQAGYSDEEIAERLSSYNPNIKTAMDSGYSLDDIASRLDGSKLSRIGGITSKSESGGNAATISTGRGDIGGKSYGEYQLASNTGTLKDFLSQSSKKDYFSGTSVGSPAFDRKWKELSQDPDFVNEQYSYIKKTHYDPVSDYLKSAYGIDPDQSKAAQELIFSTANQMGAGNAKKVFDEALSGIDEFDEATLIDRVTDVKSNVNKWFKSSPEDTKASVLERFNREREQFKGLISPQDDYSEFENREQSQPTNQPPQEDTRSFAEKAGTSLESSIYGIESAVAAAPGLATDIVYSTANLINKGINFATNATFGKKYLKDDYKAPTELYDVGGTLAKKVGLENSYLGKALSSKELKKAQEEYASSQKMAEPGKGLAGSLIDKIKRGDIKDAAEYVALSTIEQAPQNALAAIVSIVAKNPNIGLALLAGTSASAEMQESIAAEERGEGTDRGAATLNAINSGLMEYAGEKVGTAEILKPLRKQFAKVAKKEGLKAAQKKATSFATKLIKSLAGEVSSEVVTQAGQDLGAMFTGTKDITLEQFANNLADAGVLAVTSTGPFAVMSSASKETTPTVTQPSVSTAPAVIEQEATLPSEESFFNTGSPEAFIEQLNNTQSPSGKEFMVESLSEEERAAVNSVLSQEGVLSDQEDIQGIQGGEQVGKTTVEEQPVQEPSTEETETGGVLQTQEEVIPKNVWSKLSYEEIKRMKDENPGVVFEGLDEATKQISAGLEKLSPHAKTEMEVTEAPEDLTTLETITTIGEKTLETGEKEPVDYVEVTRLKRPDYKEGQKTIEAFAEKENLPNPDAKGKIKISKKQRQRMTAEDIIRIKNEMGDNVEFDKELEDNISSFMDRVRKLDIPKKAKSDVKEGDFTKLEEFIPHKDIVGMIIPRKPVPEATTTSQKIATFEDIKKLSESRKGRETIKNIAAEAGIKLSSKQPWQKFALEYTKKTGTSEDITAAEELYSETFSESRKEGAKAKKKERASKTGDERTELQKSKDTAIDEIVDQGYVEYNPEKHGSILKSVKKTESGKFVPVGMNKQWAAAIEIKDINGKPYLAVKDEGLNIIERYNAERGGVKLGRQPYEEKDSFEDLRYNKSAAKKTKYEEIKPTIEQSDYAKTLSDKDIDVQIQNGMMADGEIMSTPQMFVTSKDEHFGTTIAMPINSTKEQILKKLEEKRKQFVQGDVRKLTKEMKRFFSNLKDNDFPDVQFGGLGPDVVLANHEYGVIGRRSSDGKLVIAINENVPTHEIASTVAHELLGHFGASKVISEVSPELGSRMYDLFQKDSDSDMMSELREDYGNDEEVLFDEWVARNVEEASKKYLDKDGKFNENAYKQDSSVLKKVMDTIRKLVGDLLNTWFQKPASKQEIEDTTIAVMQRFADIKTTETTQLEPRYSRRTNAAKKAAERKRRLRTYATDRMNLDTAKDRKSTRVRFFDFAMKHFYGPGSESIRRELFGLMDKVKDITDPAYKKALNRVDEYADWQSSRDAYTDYKKFTGRIKKNLSLKDPKIKQIKGLMGEVNELNDKLSLYKELKRLANRGEVDRPYKKGTEEYGNPGLRYQRMIDGGYIDMEVFDAGAYQLNDAGKEKLKSLKEDLTTPSGDMFGTTDIVDKTETMKSIYHDLTKAIKDTKINRKSTVNEAKNEIVKQVETKGKEQVKGTKRGVKENIVEFIKKSDLTTLNLEYIANNIDNFDPEGPVTKYVFNPLLEGHNKSLDFNFRVKDKVREGMSSIPKDELIRMSPSFQGGLLGTIEKATTRKPKEETIKLDSGKSVVLTPSQKISIYMLSKSQEGLKHLTEGGISHDNNSPVFKMTVNDIENISKSLNKHELKVAETYAAVADMVRTEGNKVSNKDVGYDIFNEENYHPLLVRKEYIEEDVSGKKITSLEDMRNILKRGTPGVLKKRRNSSAPVILEGVFESFARTLPVAEKYIGSALPSKQVNSILNDIDLKTVMSERGLGNELSMMKRLVDEFDGANIYAQQVGQKTFDAIQSLFTVATLGYKPHVAFIQPAALMSYLATADTYNPMTATRAYKNFAHAVMSPKEQTRVHELVKKYSPYLRERFEGNIDFAIGEARKISQARETAIGGKQGIRKWLGSEGAMWFMMEVDKLTNMGIFKDIEESHKAEKSKLGEDAFYRMVAKETEKVIRQTQATHDQLSRPLLYKSKLLRPLTMFTSEPVKKMMLTRRLINEFKRNPQKNYSKLMFRMSHLFLFQPLGIELVRQSFKRARGEDGDIPEELDEMLKWFGKRILIDNLGVYPVIGGMLASALSGFEIDVGGSPNKLIQAMVQIPTDVGRVIDGTKDISDLGDSIKKVINLVAPIKGLEQIKDTLQHQYDKLMELANDRGNSKKNR